MPTKRGSGTLIWSAVGAIVLLAIIWVAVRYAGPSAQQSPADSPPRPSSQQTILDTAFESPLSPRHLAPSSIPGSR